MFQRWCISRFLVFLLACLIWVSEGTQWSVVSFAQGLPAEAQGAFEKGKIAARQGAWDVALGYFEEAFVSAPKEPQVLYGVGTAHKELGHPVLAAVFFKAYLEAWPDAPNADRVRKSIATLEVFIDRLVKDLFKEAIVAAEELPEDDDKTAALHTVVQHMARAGELALVRRVGLKHPSGVPKILEQLAVRLVEEFDHIGKILSAADPVKLFDLAEEISKAEADYEALRPRSSFEVEKYFGVNCPYVRILGDHDLSPLRRCQEKAQRRFKKEESQRRVYYQGDGFIFLAVYLKKAGFDKRAYHAWLRGNKLLRQSGIEGMDFYNPISCSWKGMCMKPDGGSTLLSDRRFDKYSDVSFSPNGIDHTPNIRALSGTPWLKIVSSGRTESPMDFNVTDAAFVHLAALIEKNKLIPLPSVPPNLAKLAGTLAVARLFLEVNPG